MTFAAGVTTGSITLDLVDDTADEPDETVTVTLSNPLPSGAATIGTAAATGTITDDDVPVVTVAAETGAVREGNDVVFILTRTGLVTDELVVTFTVTGGGAVLSEEPPTEATFGAGASTVRVPLATDEDEVDDPDATVTLTLADGDAYDLGASFAATVTVRDALDSGGVEPVVTVAAESDTVTEGEDAVFILTRTRDLTDELVVTFAVTGGGAVLSEEPPTEVTFGAGSATASVPLGTEIDDTHEADAAVTLTLTDGDAYDLGTTSAATVTVQDDDDSPATGSVTITGTATEGETLSADTSGLTDADGLADAAWAYQWVRTPSGGSDADISGATGPTYVPVFADAGATLKVRVTVTDDEGHEATFTSEATSAVAAAPRPSVTVTSDGDVTEGDTVTFTLTRTGDTAQTLDVAYEVAATGDFGAATGAGTATFLANDATVQVSVATTGDATHEAHGSVTVTLTADTSADPAYLLGEPSTATAAVEDDDDFPASGSVTITGTATEGETLTADTTGLTDADGLDNAAYVYQWVRTPAGGSDADISGATSQTYVPVFADAGATLKVKVTVTDDEGHEASFTSTPTSAVAALPRPEVTVASDGDVTEGDTVTFTLTRTGNPAQTLDVAYTVAATGNFGVTTGAGTATFLANDATVQVTVATTGDSTHEAHGSVTVTLTADTSADPAYLLGDPSTATAAVEDDDDSPATGAVTITGTATEGETLTADTSGLTDGDGLDSAAWAYQWVRTPSGGSEADIPGATSQTYVPVLADGGTTLKVRVTVTDDEGHEATFTSAATPAVAALPRPSVTVAAETDTVTEGKDAVFILTRTKDPSDALVVSFAVTGGDAVLSEDPPTEATFRAGAATVRVSLGTENDDTHGADAALTLTLTDGDAYDLGEASSATVTVRDDDVPPPVLSIGDAGAREGNSGDTTARFTVTLDRAAAVAVTVDWATADGTATAGTDYTAGEGTLTFSGGVLSKTIAVPVTGDDVDEPNETFTVELSNASGASLGEAVGTGTIRDDDDAPTVTLVLTPASITEAAGRSTVTARLDHPSSEETAVTVTVAPKSPAVEGDYTLSANLELTIAAGVTTSTGAVTITAVNNAVDAPNKAVTVSATAENTQGITAPQEVTLTIRDDENVAPTGAPTIDDTTPVVGETLMADPSGIGDTDGLTGATYTWRWLRVASGGTETQVGTGASYTVVAGDVGSTLKVEASFTDDGGAGETVESAETAAVEAAPLPTVSVARVSSPVSEGADAEFLVTRTAVTAGALTVRYGVSESGAMVVASEEGAKTIDFGDGETEKTVAVPTVDDSVHEADSTVTFRLAPDAAYEVGTAASGVIVQDDDDSPATGAVAVAGTVVEGETLTADTSGLTDGDGLDSAAYVYQWVRTPSGGSDADISGATGATYVPVFADVGATLKVRVTVTDDEGHEATFESAATPAVAARARPSVTAASDGGVAEGSAAVFTLTRTGDTAEELDVAYTVTAAGDFGAATGAGTASFLADSATVQVSVATTGDSIHEAHGSVTLTLTADTGADPAYLLGDPATATAAVEDDDDSPATGAVTITGTATEGETLTADTSGLADGDGLANATWVYQWVRTPSGGSGADISGATEATYVPVFADAGATLKVRVTVTDDEGHEATFTSAPTSAVAATPRPVVTVVSDGDVTEGDTVTFTLTRAGDPAATLDVAYEVTATGDFGAATGAGTATFPADSATVQVSVATTGDGAHEAHGSVTVTLTADTGADSAYLLGDPATATAAVEDDDDSPATGSVTVTGTAAEGETLTADTSGLTDADGLANAAWAYQWVRTPSGGSGADISGATSKTYTPVLADGGTTLKVRVTVTDDEGHEATFTSAETAVVPPSVTVAPRKTPVSEGDPAAEFTVTRTGDTTEALRVRISVSETGDMVSARNEGEKTRTIPAGQPQVLLSVPTIMDSVHEADSVVTLALVADAAYELGTERSAAVTVEDDDNAAPTGTVTIDDTTPMVGETLTASSSGVDDPDGLTSPTYAWQWVRTSGGTETEIAGATSASYTVAAADGGAKLKVEMSFTDDDGTTETLTSAETAVVPPSVTVAPRKTPVSEGDPAAEFTLTRTGDTTEALRVRISVSETGDMVSAGNKGEKTRTIPAGQPQAVIPVPTVNDSVHEADSVVTLALVADPAYELGTERSAEVTVRDDDDSPATGSVTITGTPTEGETLSADTSGLADGDGLDDAAWVYQWVRTPSGGSDADISGATGATYVPVFADAGATLKVRVTVTDDEGHEATFTSAATSAVAATPRPVVTVVSDGDVTEGDTVTFTLTRTGDPAETLDVAYEVAATGDFGVTTGAGTATFPADSATVQVSVDTTGDDTHEAHGSVTVTVTLTADTGVDPAYLLGDPSAATAAVEDDDDSPATGTVTIDDTTPTEGETLTADTSGLADADGLANVAYVYQWVRTPAGGSDEDISGATGATYVPVFADAGATLKVRVTVTDDEGHQASFTSAPTSAVAALPRPSVTVTSDGDVTEGSPAEFTLTRTGDPAATLDVAYEVTATGSFGVTTGAGTATFPANSATVQVSVATTGDSAHEAHGSVTVTLTADTGTDPAYLLGAPATATAAVQDDDDSPATGSVTVTGTATEGETLSADTSGITDADGLANAVWAYRWVRTPPGGGNADISGATGATYVPVFADVGATLKVRVTVTDDEGHRATFTSASTSAVAALPRPSVTVVSDGDVTEGDTVTFTLTRTGDPAETLDVAYAVTATGDFGVTTGAGTATFLANSSTVQVSVATTGDDTHEAHGTVTVTLTADTGADPAYLLGAPSTATAAVEDDDDSPATGTVTIDDTTPTEGETLTADTSALADGDGLDDAAYVYQWVRTPSGGSDGDISGATSQTYVPVFADAGTTLKVRVTVTDDEGHEATFTSASTSAVAATPRPVVTVVSDGDVTEGSAAVFTLIRTGDPAQTLEVAYEVTATGDFGAATGAGTATFPADSATVQVSVATTGDSTHEAHGSATVTLTADGGTDPAYLLGDPSAATAAVEDDDDSPATGSVTVTGTPAEGETLTADTSGLTDADGLANAAWAYQWVRTPAGGSGADISGATLKSYVPVLADGGTTLKVRVTVTDDEGHEATFTSAETAVVPPSVTVAPRKTPVTEGKPAEFMVTRTGDTTAALRVRISVSETGDMVSARNEGEETRTLPAGQSQAVIPVPTVKDSVHEADSVVTLALVADPAYELGTERSAEVTVEDDDDSPATGSVTVTGTPTEGETLTVDTSGLADGDGLDDAAYVYQWVRTPAGGSDGDISGATSQTYVPVFADAGTTLKVRVTVTDDEGHEATFTSASTSAVAALPRPSVTVASDGDVTEGSPAEFTLTRTGDPAETLEVAYEVAATGDFGVTTGAGTATFLADSATVQVSVATTGDGAHEAHGSVTVTLTADTGVDPAYLLGDPATATAAVEDDDDSPATGSVTVTGTAAEGETLTADTSGLTDADGLANAAWAYQWVRTPSGGSDEDISGATSQTYVPVFADAGATLKVRVTVTDDEGHEATFTSAATSAVAALLRPVVTVVSDGDVTEGDTVTFTLTRTGDPAETLEVAYEVAATGDFGVTTGAGTATFLANSATVQVSVDTTGDGAHEAHGTVTVTLTADTGADPAYLLGDPSTATAAVRDDDDSPATGTVTIDDTTPTEGETLTADTSALADGDGLANARYAYRWVRTPAGGGNADISGATGATYVPVFADVGATLKVRVTVTDDEGHRATFTSASTSAVAALPRPSVTVVSDGDVTEGDTVTFTLTRTGDPAETLDVAYAVTATGDFGVTTGAGTATFLANSSTVQVSVATTGDDTHEAHGTVTVTLTADTGADPAYLLGDPWTATAAVGDDDDSPATGAVTVTGTAEEGETLSADTSGLTDADGLANAAYAWQWVRTPSGGSDADISGATSRTYVPVYADAGATLKVKVTVTDDEGHEATFTSAATSAVAALPEVTVASDGDVTEGSAAAFTLTRTGGSSAPWLIVNIKRSVSGDFGVVKFKTTSFPAGASTTRTRLHVADDEADEAHGAVTLTVLPGNGYRVGTPSAATAKIFDATNVAPTGAPTIDDTSPVVGEMLTADPSGIADADGLTNRTFTYQWVRVSGGTETPIDGATAVTYTVVAADVGATLKVKASFTDDGGIEETVESAATATVEAPSLPTVTVTPRTSPVTEGDPAAEFTVTRTGDTTEALRVSISVSETGEMVSAGNEGGGTRTIPAGQSSAVISVPTVDDGVHEADSVVTLTLEADAAYELGTDATAEVTVEDDDDAPLPTVSVTPVTSPVVESEDAQFTVTRTGVTTGALTVRYNVIETGAMVRSGDKGAKTVDFSGDTASVTVTVPTVSDNLHELNSRVTVTLTADAAYELGTDATARVLVKDDDDSPATGTVTVTGTAREGETLTADTSDIADEDGGLDTAAYVYQWVRTPAGGSDAAISGATEATYVPVFADTGATLKVRVTVTDGEGHEATITSAPTSAVAALPRPSVTVASAGDVTEGSPALFTLTRTGATAETLDVAYAVTATGNFGVTTGAGTATFPANGATVQVSVATTGDDTHEAHGTVTVTVTLTADTSTDPAYLLGDPSTATAAVEDDDNASPTGAVTIDDTSPVVGETLTADASSLDDPDGLTSRSFTWQWLRVSGGTETEITGATAVTYTVVAADVGAKLKVKASFTDDGGTEETVESAQTSAAKPPSPVLTVAAGTSRVTEGTAATFTVTRTVVTAGALTAHYQVSETGDAVAASDEGAKSVDFADGETGKTVTVPTAGDGGHEADSVVTVTLTADAAYDLGAQRSAEVTVEDDDNAAPTGTVTIDDTTPVVGQTLTANTSNLDDPDGLTSRSFTWQWLRVSGGTATAIAGATSASYPVAAADVGSALKVRVGFTDDDGTAETVESAPTGAVAEYTITAASPRVTEGDAGSALLDFALTRSETGQRVELGWRVTTEGTAQPVRPVTDFAGPMEGTLVFSPNTRSRSVYLQVVPDIVDELDETVVLEFFSVAGTPEGVTFPARVTGTIVDDDTATLSIASSSVDEGDSGTRELVFTVSLDLESDREVTVEYDVGGTAESGTDYEAPTPVLVTFPALFWEPQRIVFRVLGDTDAERHETVTVELRDPSGGVALGTSQATATIRNDDGLVVSVDPPEVTEGDSRADGARLTFRLELSGQADTDVTVDYRVDAGAGTATPGADFKDKSGTATIKSGRTFAVVKLGILEDTAIEPDETVVMVFENPRGAVLDPDSARVTGTILNDDLSQVTVAAEAGPVTEGEEAGVRADAHGRCVGAADGDGGRERGRPRARRDRADGGDVRCERDGGAAAGRDRGRRDGRGRRPRDGDGDCGERLHGGRGRGLGRRGRVRQRRAGGPGRDGAAVVDDDDGGGLGRLGGRLGFGPDGPRLVGGWRRLRAGAAAVARVAGRPGGGALR